jgi:enamine deaminase RidA (YjgF/YER057c/UK114 family)
MSAPELFNPAAVAAPVGHYSHGAFAKAGSDVLFLAGQVGIKPDGTTPPTLAEQAEAAFANVVAVLKAKDMTVANLAKINIYAVSGQPIGEVRAARMKYLGDHKPASTFIYVPQLADPKYLIEIEGVAVR